MFDLKFVSCLPEAEKNMTFMTLNGPNYRSSDYIAVNKFNQALLALKT